jgi:hypothetical protein
MQRSTVALAFGLSGLLVLAGPAGAQPITGIQDSLVEGPGHQVGEGTVIHPHLSLETGVINNMFYEEDSPVTTAVARVIAGVSIASQNAPKPMGVVEPGIVNENVDEEIEPPPPSKADFRLGLQLAFLGYPSGNERVRDQSDLAAALDGQVIVNPQGDVQFMAADQFIRDTSPRNFESSGDLNRDYNHAELGLMYRPGQHALGFGVRYENTIDRFEDSDTAFANRIQHTVGARAEWLYLPITKFYFDASLGFFGPLGSEGDTYKSSSMPLRIQLGVGTALTWATTLVAHVGYANGFYDTGENFNMVIGGLEFGYRYAEYGRVRLVADYDFQDSLQANYFRDFTFGAKLDQQFGLFVLHGEAGVKLRGYRGINPALGAASRDDVIFNVMARLAYLMRDNFAIGAKVKAMIDETDYMSAGGDSPKYRRFEGVVEATLAF